MPLQHSTVSQTSAMQEAELCMRRTRILLHLHLAPSKVQMHNSGKGGGGPFPAARPLNGKGELLHNLWAR
jgi:hypothetical protein